MKESEFQESMDPSRTSQVPFRAKLLPMKHKSQDDVFNSWKSEYFKVVKQGNRTCSYEFAEVEEPPVIKTSSVPAIPETTRDLSYIREKLSKVPTTSSLYQRELTYVLSKKSPTAESVLVDSSKEIDLASRILYKTQTEKIEKLLGSSQTVRKPSKSYQRPVERNPTGRRQVELLNHWLDSMLNKHVNSAYDPDPRAMKLILDEAFKELVKQIDIQCQERGTLMRKMWDLHHKAVPRLVGLQSRDSFKKHKKNRTIVNAMSLRKELFSINEEKEKIVDELNRKIKSQSALIEQLQEDLKMFQSSKEELQSQHERLKKRFIEHNAKLHIPRKSSKVPDEDEQINNTDKRTVVTSTSDLEMLEDHLTEFFEFKINKKYPSAFKDVSIRGYFDDKGYFHRQKMIQYDKDNSKKITNYKGDVIHFAVVKDKEVQAELGGIYVPREKLEYIEARVINLDNLDSVQIIAPFCEEKNEKPVQTISFKDSSTCIMQAFNQSIFVENIDPFLDTLSFNIAEIHSMSVSDENIELCKNIINQASEYINRIGSPRQTDELSLKDTLEKLLKIVENDETSISNPDFYEASAELKRLLNALVKNPDAYTQTTETINENENEYSPSLIRQNTKITPLKYNKKKMGRGTKIMSSIIHREIENKLNAQFANKSVMKLISTVYNDKLAMVKESSSNLIVPLNEVLYNKFLQRFGLKQVAEKKYKKTISLLLQVKHVKRVNNFLRFLGLFASFDLHDLDVYLSILEMNNNKNGIVYVNDEGNAHYFMSLQKTYLIVRNLFEDKLPRAEWDILKEKIDRLKVNHVQNLKDIEVVDIDILADLIFESLYKLKMQALNFLLKLNNTLTLDSYLTFEDFTNIMSFMPHSYSSDALESIFRSYRETNAKKNTIRVGFVVMELVQKSVLPFSELPNPYDL